MMYADTLRRCANDLESITAALRPIMSNGAQMAMESLCEEWRKMADESEKQPDSIRQKQNAAFRDGVRAGIEAYAWWKDGTQYVGSCGTTLKEALEKLEKGQLQSVPSSHEP